MKPTTQPQPEQCQCSPTEMRVLVLAPTGRDAVLAARALEDAGRQVAICNTIEELCRSITFQGAGALLIALEALTPPALDHLNRTLSRQPPWSDLPLILLTGSGRATEAGETLLQESERLGNAAFLERPLRITTLVGAVRVALRARHRQYEIRGYLREREQAAAEKMAAAEQQRAFLRDVLASVTEGKLLLCDSPDDLPPHLPLQLDPIALSGPALRLLRRQTLRAAETVGLDEERADDLVTSTNEAAMNAVVHAGGGVACIGVSPDNSGTIQIWIEDQGNGIEMTRLPRATLERGFSTAGTFGHGFWLMLKTCDRTYLLTGPGGTTVVLEQDRNPPPPSWMRGISTLAEPK